MVEIELKFQIAATRRNALLKAIDSKGAETLQLQAKYFDTADRKLAAQGIAHEASPTAAWVTLSIGVAVAQPQAGGRPAALVAAADAALYSAKHRGRNCISAHSGFVSTE